MLSLQKVLIILASFLSVAFQTTCVHASALAKITLKVIDEKLMPIEGAKITICFIGGCTYKEATIGNTDTKGLYTMSALSSDGQVGGEVAKDGYYYNVFHNDLYVTKHGIWQPWNKEILVVLRPKVNPVPMYVRNCQIDIPYLNKEIGFDLIKSDWVIPYGQGVTSDLIFKAERDFKSVDEFNSKVTLTFANRFDGIQVVKDDPGGDFNTGSRYRLPRNAPETGYKNTLIKRRSRGKTRRIDDKDDNTNYIFRVRSEEDEKGLLKRAMYGKFRGDLTIDPRGSKTVTIFFLYYLNPDYTGNLEFDPDRNLINPLPKGEYPIGLP